MVNCIDATLYNTIYFLLGLVTQPEKRISLTNQQLFLKHIIKEIIYET